MERYRIARAGSEIGEYGLEEIRQYLASGNLQPTDHAWKAGMDGWKTLGELGIAIKPAPAPAPVPRPGAPARAVVPAFGGGAAASTAEPKGSQVVAAIGFFFLPVGLYVLFSKNYPRRTKTFLGAWYAAVFALMIIAGNQEHVPAAYPPHQIYVNAKQFVPRVLKSPSTARFPSVVGDNPVRAYGHFDDGRYFVEGVESWVDAQNSFGAMIRSSWEVWYIRDGTTSGGGLRPVWIRLGDDDVLNDRRELDRLRELARKPGGLSGEMR